MKRALASAFCFCCLMLSLCLSGEGQVALGTPKFSSLGGGPFDTVNLGNLNVHFVVPILQKAGRGVAFSYNLTYDGSIWQPVISGSTKTWARVGSNTWGWTSSMVGGGQVTENQTIDQEPCILHGLQKTETTITTSGIIYFDGFGTPHRFFAFAVHKTGCTTQDTGAGTKTALDGSGYQVTIDSSGDILSLTARDGSLISATVGNPVSITDANGNSITSAFASGTTTYTDTLGLAVLKVSGSGTPSSPVTLQYTSPSAGSPEYTINYTSYTVKTNFGLSGISEYGPIANSLVSSIQLPDGTSYSFTYEQTPGSCTPLSGTFKNCITGRIASVTIPTGGTVTYLYSGGPNNTGIFADGSTAGLKRILTASTTCSASTSCWQYSRSLVSGTPGTGSTWTTTVVDPNSNNTVINFAEDAATISGTVPSFNMYETQRKAYQGAVSSTACSATTTNNCLLLTSFACYNTNFSSCATSTVSSPITQRDFYTQLPNGSTRLSETTYNSTSGLVTDDREYGYGVTTGSAPGTSQLVKETVTTYGSFNGSGCTALGNSITGRPCQVVVNDWTSGSAKAISTTSYTYDQGTPTQTSGTPQHFAVSGSRGNPTTIATLTTGSTSLSKTITYFDTGTPNVFTDVNGAQTTYVYSSGANPFNSSQTASCGNSFVTTIKEPLSLSRSTEWNCEGGVAEQVTDENSQIVKTDYTDTTFWRPADTIDQESNETTISYFGSTAQESSLLFNSNDSVADSRNTVDGFGRPILTQTLQAPGSSNYDTSEIDYDSVGRPDRVTMPFVAASGGTSSTAPAKLTTYDTLGRPLTITDAAGGTVSNTYINNDVLQKVSGSQVFQKQFEYDGLGRLVSVCEITGASGSGSCGQSNSESGFLTKYTYDALGRLTGVGQNAQGSPVQTRSYGPYDGLGRITSESNPESGTVAYIYDTSDSTCGSFASAGDLVEKKDAIGNVTCIKYDALHRTTQVTYPVGSYASATPTKCFVYDSATVNGTAMPIAKARLAEAYTTTATSCTGSTKTVDEGFGYSARGEVSDVYESTPNSGGFYHVNATYFPHGKLNQLSGIPGTPAIIYGWFGGAGPGLDGEGRVTRVAVGGPNPDLVPFQGVVYNNSGTSQPIGTIASVTYGDTDNDSFQYDPNTGRMTAYTLTMGTGMPNFNPQVSGALTWNTNGTLQQLKVTDTFQSSNSQTCTYAYDDLARITSANCGSVWSQTFGLDPFGNLTKSGSGSFQPLYNMAKNQYSSIPGGGSTAYDLNGNLTNDVTHSYTWDADGNNISVDGSTVTMIYDALDRMIEQTRSSGHQQILYGPTGQKLALMDGQTLVKAFFGLPGGGTAVYGSSGVSYFRHADHLGSSRFATSPSHIIVNDVSYAPYGEDYNGQSGEDLSFTGQNQDTVGGGFGTNLYDFPFREYRTAHGRWISPDPAGMGAVDPTDPQTWNRYAYVGNRPLNATDPLGLDDNDTGFLPPDPGDGGGGSPCDPSDPTCGGIPCGFYGPCSGPQPQPLPFPPAYGGGYGGGVSSPTGGGSGSGAGSGILPGENSTNFPIGSGNPLNDLWQALGLPSLPCQTQFGPWCDPGMLPDPWILDAEPGVPQVATAGQNWLDCYNSFHDSAKGRAIEFFSALSWFPVDRNWKSNIKETATFGLAKASTVGAASHFGRGLFQSVAKGLEYAAEGAFATASAIDSTVFVGCGGAALDTVAAPPQLP